MIKIPDDERHRVFLVNRVEGMRAVHYGSPLEPTCRDHLERPWITSWFVEDVTCKRCRGLLGMKP